ncbi:hypothetical protein [Phenylobacterium deserti]|uniref:Uncharacterized protein n=1 Tax=Phenylobacterium deserti TaxID=1914756 RepID=A0A328AVY0_9CAUL|nr:hypothetical protein [Phenylobacterium deserti]RAK57856.1 hypothetical protein DJ018_08075 [Phenylobacterium deserti]
MGTVRRLAVTAGVISVAGVAGAQPAQKVTGPVATYWVSAQTQTGFGLPGMGGGASRPSAMGMMGAMMGMRGNSVSRTLTLQLGSSRQPTGAPTGEHLPPASLGLGQSLPLVTPTAQPVQKVDETPDVPREWQKPRGRMLIFWGCGERARSGQPVAIDFSQLQGGKIPAGLEAITRGLGVTPMQPPAPGRSTTYGEWPNARTRAASTPTGSLFGEHVVKATYSPEIRFALNGAQDFLGPINLATNARTPAGSVQLGWNAVPNARAYLATVIGGGRDETVVLWSSSEVQASAFSMPDYISPSDLTRLVGSRALLSPQTTQCQVPREVVEAAGGAGLVQLNAYGDEANFIYPPRPSDPKAAWNREWQVKVRYRSSTGGMLGMAMPGMAAEEAGPAPRGQPQPPNRSPGRSILRGLGAAAGVPIP